MPRFLILAAMLLTLLGFPASPAHATGRGKPAGHAGKAAKPAAKPGKADAKPAQAHGKPTRAAGKAGKPAGKTGKSAKDHGKSAKVAVKAAKGASQATGVGKAAKGAARTEAAQDAEDDAKPLSAKDKKKRALLAKTCATASAKKTAACKSYVAEQKGRNAAAERAALKKTCSLAKNKKCKTCKSFLVSEQRRSLTINVCGRKYGVAKKNEKVSAFARRHRVAESRLRDLNDLGSAAKLKGGKRYLVFKSPHDGVTLQGGVLLEAEPNGFALQRPFRGWGKPLLVDALRLAAQQVQASAPEGTTLVFGDLSKEGGGCLAPHKSHRGGLDADVGFFYRGAHQRKWLGGATTETLDADRTWLFIKALLATGRLQMAFIDYALQHVLYEAALRAGETPQTLEPIFQFPRPIERIHESVVRHLGGHDNHMHVRVICPEGSECTLADDARNRMIVVRMEQRGGVMSEGRSRRVPTGAVPELMR